MEGCGDRVSCRNLFKKLQIFLLTSQYILFLLMLVIQNKNLFLTNVEKNFYLPQTKLNNLSKSSLLFGDKNF
jgi:hypothetical protein